jgi:hypothetical protein
MVNDYKERIMAFLDEATQPADMEKIRAACKIGNWNTAMKHCLELYSQGSIQGQKTTKGWIFWTHEETHLNIWEEAVGRLEKVEESETQTVALLTCIYKKQIAIPLPKNQPETQKLQKLLGQKIAILKTDNPEKPLIIRSFNETTAAQNTISTRLWVRRRMLIVLRNSVFSEGGC